MTLPLAAEQMVAEWSDRNHTIAGPREQALVEHVLTQLTDPGSDHGSLLLQMCGIRWAAYRDKAS